MICINNRITAVYSNSSILVKYISACGFYSPGGRIHIAGNKLFVIYNTMIVCIIIPIMVCASVICIARDCVSEVVSCKVACYRRDVCIIYGNGLNHFNGISGLCPNNAQRVVIFINSGIRHINGYITAVYGKGSIFVKYISAFGFDSPASRI